MQQLTILEVEERLLNHIKSVLKQVNGKRAQRNLFAGIKTTGMLRKVVPHINVLDDSGWGHSTTDYSIFLVMNYYGVTYVGTISYSYSGGSCGCCDAVEAARDNYQEAKYMTGEINLLKFKTFAIGKSKPSRPIPTKSKALNVESLIEFPLLK